MNKLEDYKKLLDDSDLNDAIISKKVCLFLGAGVARNIGMPDWNGLASNITAWCLKNKLIKHSEVHTLNIISNPLKIISYCTQQIKTKDKENVFNNYLKEIFIEKPMFEYEKNSKLYNNFIKLYKSGKVLLVQTNYDKEMFFIIEDFVY